MLGMGCGDGWEKHRKGFQDRKCGQTNYVVSPCRIRLLSGLTAFNKLGRLSTHHKLCQESVKNHELINPKRVMWVTDGHRRVGSPWTIADFTACSELLWTCSLKEALTARVFEDVSLAAWDVWIWIPLHAMIGALVSTLHTNLRMYCGHNCWNSKGGDLQSPLPTNLGAKELWQTYDVD